MIFKDRIKVTSTSTSTSTFILGLPVTGYIAFTDGIYKYCIVNATETEWEVGEGSVTSGVLTRTTIEASSNSNLIVNFSAGTKYVFNTVSATYISTLVPYTGATSSLNLGAYNLTATQIIKVGGTATQFLKADGSVDSTTYMNRAVYDADADGIVDAAMAMRTIGRNATGATLYKGTVVYISGSTGNRPNFVKAQANSEATSAGTFGVVYADIANNSDGYVVTIGTIDTLDTRTTATNPFTSVTLADGDTVYLDPNTAGYITNVKPSAPNHLVYVGKVTRTSPTQGTIVYRIQNGYELDEIHDVAITSKANNDVLVYESATTLWKNKSIATILGYTPQAAITLTTTGSSGAATFVSNTLNIPTYTLSGLGGVPTTRTLTINGTAYDLSADRSWTVGGGISGSGTAGQVTYWTGSSTVGGSSTFTYTPTTALAINNSVTASGAIARGIYLTPILTAAANNDVLVGLDINPTFTNGAFTGVSNFPLRIRNAALINVFSITNTGVINTYDPSGNQFMQINGTASGSTSMAIGSPGGSATASGSLSLALGRSASATAQDAISIGNSNTASGTYSVAIGSLSTASGSFSIGIGRQANTNSKINAIAFNGTAYNDYQFVAGNITEVYFGSGVRTYNTAATSYSINGSGGGTNIPTAGGDITIAGGKGVGTSEPGRVYLATPVKTTGSNLQSLVNRFAVVQETGNILIQNGGTFTDGNYRVDISASGTGATNGALRLLGGKALFAASTTSYPSLNIPSGSAPTTPTDGDIWQDNTNIYIRIGGTTKTFTLI